MRFIFTLIISATVLLAARAWPCKCGGVVAAQPGFISWAPRRHLPANAKGVVFFVPLPAPTSLEGRPYAFFIDAVPKPLDPKSFTATDVTTGKPVKLHLTPLAIESHFPWGELRVLSSKTDFSSCRRNLNCPELEKKFRAGKLDDVSRQTLERSLLRVEPDGGFVAGHAYHFEYTPNHASVDVIIDEAKVEDLAATLELDPPTFGKVTLPTGTSCSAQFSASSQTLRMKASPTLEPYRDSLLFFATEVREGAKWEALLNTFESICDQRRWGRSVLPPGEERLDLICPNSASSPTELHTTVRADWVFLEVDGVMRSTAPREVSLSVKDTCSK